MSKNVSSPAHPEQPSPPSPERLLVEGNYALPYDLLGMKQLPSGGVIVRALNHFAKAVWVVDESGTRYEMTLVESGGLYEVEIPERETFNYTLLVDDVERGECLVVDPYAFPVEIPDLDLYLFGEGTHFRTYEHMGAHLDVIDGVEGARFTVWAPNANRVSVTGDFNRWDGRATPMQSMGGSGVWGVFVPGLKHGDLYKFEIKGDRGFVAQKSDPYAFAAEVRPRTASRVWDLNQYAWGDEAWMSERRTRDNLNSAISVYEVHLGSWKRVPDEDGRFLTYRELAAELIPYVKGLGFTHIELLPVTEHPFDGSWGYQTLGYYAVTSRFGDPDEFKYFVDQCHQNGLGVILDWVPAHFPKDPHGLAYFDGSHLYEHADPRKGQHMDWGTLIFNYGRNEVRTFLLSSAMFWAEVYHIDGIRVDAVASMLYLDYSRKAGQWVPNEFGGRENLDAVKFLQDFNEIIHREYPGFLTFAEESTSWPMVSQPSYLGGLGFGLKWNMGWMNDTLQYFEKKAIHRKYHHGELTFSLIYAFNENFILPFSHDEVVHGKRSMLDKMPGDFWQKFANLRLLYTYMWMHPGKKLLFMGCEFGQWREWNSEDQLEWHLTKYDPHVSLRRLVSDLNHLQKSLPCLHELDFEGAGFEWIDLHDHEQSILSFIRRGKNPEDCVAVVLNFTPVLRKDYRLGVPLPGGYREVLNSDSELYGGSNAGNGGFIQAEPTPWMGQKYSVSMTLPPLGGVVLRPQTFSS